MYGLKTLELPSTLTEIGERLITGMTGLTTVISHITEPFAVSDATFANRVKNEGTQEYELRPSPATLYVPAGSIAKYQALSGWRWFANIREIQAPVDGIATSDSRNTGSRKAFTISGTRVDGRSKGVVIMDRRKVLVR